MNSGEASVDEWNEAGDELRRVDPILFNEILTLVKRAVLAQKDPSELLRTDCLIRFGRGGSRGSA